MSLRTKIVITLVTLVIFGTAGVYPIAANYLGFPQAAALNAMALKLGLDLKGGVHLVLRVETDTALRVETEGESERLRERLTTDNIPVTGVTVVGPTQFRVEGVPQPQDAAFRQAAIEVEANYDRSAGTAGAYTFTLKPIMERQMRDEAVIQARQTIERRVNELGVAEPSIAQQGQNGDEILVQLPGVAEIERAKSIIGSPGMLELKIVEQGPASAREELLVNGQPPAGMDILPGADNSGGGAATTVYYSLRKVAAVTGRDLRNARPGLDENNLPAVNFSLNQEGARKFGQVTGANIGRQLAIILDNRVFSAPVIESRITSEGSINGSYTTQEAQDLALVLRSGALPAQLTYLQEQAIGPTLGADSIRSGVIASLAGLALIVSFMLVYYRLSGINAIIAMGFNLVILLGLMAYLGAVMTLPGIAGFVLTMGIGVDSNVLILERIKEELEANRGVRAAINAGFSRVFLTLLDTHVAAVIGALFLFQFGTGPIRGFATTLFIGLAANLFTSTFVSKTLFELVLSRRRQAAALSI